MKGGSGGGGGSYWKVLKPKRPITDKHIHTEVVQGRRMVTKFKGTISLLMNFNVLV